jgi:hypothetical protein
MKLVVIGSVIFLFTFSAGAGTFLEDFDNNFGVWQELLVLDELPGSWKIVDGELHAVSPEGWTRLLTVGDETWRDYTIEFDVKPLDKQGPSNIVIAARINGSWVAWCLIGDLPSFNDNVSRVMFAAGNFQDPSTFVFFHIKPHRFLKLNKWSKLKLDVKENILNFWINGNQVIGPVQLPNRKWFEGFDAIRKGHAAREGEQRELPALQLNGFQDFLTGAAGLGLLNQTARFDNVVITGDSIPDRGGLSVNPMAKLATVWGSLKRF